jgi:hypothetical protein
VTISDVLQIKVKDSALLAAPPGPEIWLLAKHHEHGLRKPKGGTGKENSRPNTKYPS